MFMLDSIGRIKWAVIECTVPILLLGSLTPAQGQEPPNVDLAKKATAGDLKSQLALGEKYRLGIGVTQDYAESLRWYRLAARQNSPDAQFTLGEMYRHGEGVGEDYKETVRWYSLA